MTQIQEAEAAVAPTTKPNALICDLGDVLFTWSAPTTTSIPISGLGTILRSSIWEDYERGRYDEDEAYSLLSERFGYEKDEIRRTFVKARESLKSSALMMDLIRRIRRVGGGVKVFAMSNISKPDWEVLKTKATDDEWALFDRVFISAEANERKPDLAFFTRVIQSTGVDPSRTVFIDDKEENVDGARKSGMIGLKFDKEEEVVRMLEELFLSYAHNESAPDFVL